MPGKTSFRRRLGGVLDSGVRVIGTRAIVWATLSTALGCADSNEPTSADAGTTTGSSTTGSSVDGSSSDGSAATSTDPSTTTSTTSATQTATSATDDGATTTGSMPTAPSELLDLESWKLTLPVGSAREPDEPWEILQPELDGFELDPWFVLTKDATGVRFRAHAGGMTTSNSGYPRSELREMTDGGGRLASWSTIEGTHTMTVVQAITVLPDAKPHVVAGQIHDADDDLIMIRLEGEHLFVEGDGDELGDLDPAYVLGTVFTVRIVAADGTIDVYYDDLDTPAVTVERDAVGCYFKAGAYTQSNESTGDDPDAYGEVVISDLDVVHR
jgi:poly(beta-D-mannuronate) lyase